MRELNTAELQSVSGGWNNYENPTQDPFENDSRSLTVPGMFDSNGGGHTGGSNGPTVSGGVTAEGGSNGVDSWSAEGAVDFDGDGQPDVSWSDNSDDQWSAEYTFDNGVSIGISNHTDGGPNTPGNSGSFGTITIPF